MLPSLSLILCVYSGQLFTLNKTVWLLGAGAPFCRSLFLNPCIVSFNKLSGLYYFVSARNRMDWYCAREHERVRLTTNRINMWGAAKRFFDLIIFYTAIISGILYLARDFVITVTDRTDRDWFSMRDGIRPAAHCLITNGCISCFWLTLQAHGQSIDWIN